MLITNFSLKIARQYFLNVTNQEQNTTAAAEGGIQNSGPINWVFFSRTVAKPHRNQDDSISTLNFDFWLIIITISLKFIRDP
jgi:hypothetical protein